MDDLSTPKTKIRLAVLGGGPSTLSSLYHITADPDTRAKYEITVYQMGWRLGGKGASGRADYGRIEEHGLHVLFGFYNNFFSMMKGCYEEIKRPPGQPLATWDDAFKPHNFGVVEDFFQDKWQAWPLEFPTNDAVPGSDDPVDSEEDYLSMFGQALIELLLGWRALYRLNGHKTIFNQHNGHAHSHSFADPFISVMLRLVEWPLKRALAHPDEQRRLKCIRRIVVCFQKFLWPLANRWAQSSLEGRRLVLGCDFIMAIIKGVIDDKVFTPGGFNRIDQYDLREWLQQHGIHQPTLHSPYCRTIYDAAFSYEDGDPNKQRIAAGAALRALLRMGFTYKGAAYYKMQAGMGDTVFTPIYEVLKKRGVRFKFFHKIDSLHLSAERDANGQRSVASIKLTEQAFLKADSTGEYNPLEVVEDLQCWPAKPLYEQLQNEDILRQYDLESYYDQPPEKYTTKHTLTAGEDYDKVLYGIPVGAVPYVCEELVDDSERWQKMVEHVRSVTTISLQLWLKKDLKELGWTLPSPLLSLYVEPLNTWADMSQVIGRESWPASLEPKNIGYYTGAQPGTAFAPDPRLPENANFESEQYELARQLSLEYCENYLTTLMPGALAAPGAPAMDWNLLVDPEERQGRARFESQYWRSNCGPSERCTLALPGATQYRMKADETGYSNLYITGDWIDNGLYVACMEGAVTSGIYGARAVTGIEYPIIGEKLNQQ